MATDIGGVWRTVGGRRIFIKDGEDLATAMKNSGKFDSKENNNVKDKIKSKEDEINKIQKQIDILEDELYFGGSEEKNKKLDELLNQREKLQKEKLDIMARNDKSIIQDKELRDFVYDYTNGDYSIACGYTQKLANGMGEKAAFEETNYYLNSGVDKISNEQFTKKIELSQKLSEEIEKNKIDNTLIRFEKTQMDEHYNDLQHKYEVGEEINWGIRSTSANEDYFDKVMNGQDKIKGSSINSAYPYTYTEFRIVGEKKGLNISKYSQYKDQNEVLVKGKFIVKKVENFKPSIVYDTKNISFKEYLKNNNYDYEIRTSKKTGNQIIEIKDKSGKAVYSNNVKNVESNTGGNIKDIINGKVPYEKQKIENKEKSIYGIARQIVTIEYKK